MKYILISLLIIAFIGCTSNKTKEAYTIQPANYQESVLDTLINTDQQLSLKIKKYTLDTGFKMTFTYNDTLKETILFKDYAGEITLTQNSKTLFKSTIVKEDFNKLIENKDFLKNSYLNWIELVGYNNQNNEITFKCMVVMVDSDYAYIFSITLNHKGEKQIRLQEIT